MSIIQAAGSGEVSTGFYKLLLDQSLKFNDDDAQYLTRTPASAGDRQKFTLSFWMKRGNLSSTQDPFSAGNSSTDRFEVMLTASDNLQVYMNNGGTIEQVTTTQVFRDVSAWYHIVLAFDTTDGTAANRLKVYVNGSQVTDFSTYDMSTVNFSTAVNSTSNQYISKRNYVDDRYFDGCLAEINLIDGTQLTAASFGETVRGIWTPKDTSGLTFGTNGFHLTFKDDVVSEGFNTVTYTGTGASNSVSGIGFKPDFTWIKKRNNTRDHQLVNSVVGYGNGVLLANQTDAEYTAAARVDSSDADGFTVSSPDQVNADGDTFVAWNWQAGGAPTADNSAGAGATPTAGSVKINGSNLGSALAGTIPATRLSANTSKGFSIVTYTGTGSAATVAHGLGATPKWMIIKNRGVATWWTVYHTSLGATKYVRLNSNSAQIDNSNVWNDTEPTSSVFTVATVNDVNASGNTYVAYCWTDISGYSKFGTWQNNNSTTGTQVTGLGFKPAWMMVKDIDAGETWYILDNTRQPTNVSPPSTKFLIPNANSAEGSNNASTATIDFQDDGFQIKTTNPASGEISYGTRNYIYMAFADTREAAFFKDVTTNGNHFTPVNLDYRDSVPDTPTNNFNTTNVLSKGSYVDHSNGNLTVTGNTSSNNGNYLAFPRLTSGKYYYEQYINIVSSYPYFVFNVSLDTFYFSNGSTGWPATSNVRISAASGGGYTGLGASTGDIIGIAVDLDSGTKTVKIYKNNSLLETINITTSDAGIGMAEYNGSFSVYNFGQDSSFAGLKATSNANADANGHGSFAYAPPSGYLALCSQNLPDVDIIDGTENFSTVLYTGNAGTQSIAGVGFDPDFVWAKNRASGSYHHELYDTVRGDNKRVFSSQADAEATGYLQFISDGFSLTAGGGINANGNNHVAWNWLAGGSAVTNNDGSVASSVSANTKAGFSIVKHDNGSGTRTVGHGLNSAPEIIFERKIDASGDWIVQFTVIDGTSDYMRLNTTVAKTNGSNALPTATVYSPYVGGGADCLAYCFHSVEGYSKIGSYVGNGNADGTFVFTGFRPAFTIIKRVDATQKWGIQDAVREPSNEIVKYLEANTSSAEIDNYLNIDYLSNGFKLRRNEVATNASGGTYIYIAFADQPFKFSNAR